MRVVLVATHPIQYHVPWYQQLAASNEVDLKVLYSLLPDSRQQGVGFGTGFEWDIPLLEGYAYEVLPNSAKSPSIGGSFFSSRTPTIRKRIHDLAPDVVILTGWQSWSLVQALFAARRERIPLLIRGESRLRARPWWVRALHRQLLHRFDGFLAIGERNREFYLANGAPEDRIFDCPYFVDNRRFQGQLEEVLPKRKELRDSWGIPDGSVCFLFAGKLIPKKRIMDLLAALKSARQRNPHIHLLIVGSGEQEGEAREYAEERNLPVTLAGFLNQTEITRAYAAADCLVLPSDWGETWGLVVNEAMACGLPAIVSDRVGCALPISCTR